MCAKIKENISCIKKKVAILEHMHVNEAEMIGHTNKGYITKHSYDTHKADMTTAQSFICNLRFNLYKHLQEKWNNTNITRHTFYDTPVSLYISYLNYFCIKHQQRKKEIKIH